ncbi:hypothetical protein [Nocardia sp. NPDC052566]|uniref:hypothetical protein n=1 Tax=Nocardia sp. NPDC052566 TaxID=3364330 RepID=UPI0037CB76CA
MISGATDRTFFFGYQSVAAFFAIALLRVLHRSSAQRDSNLLVMSTLLIGLPFYEMVAIVYASSTKHLVGLGHLAALGTHLLALAWNYTTVLVVVSWRTAGPLSSRQYTLLAAPFVAGAVTLVGLFTHLYSNPYGANYILYIRGSPAGDLYIVVFATCMLASKVLIIAICVSQLRHLRRHTSRFAVYMVVAGSIGIAVYAIGRLTLASWFGLADPARWNSLPACANAVGAVLYASGVALPRELALLGTYLANIRNCAALAPLAKVCARTFPQISTKTIPRIPRLYTPQRAALQLLECVVFLSDCATMARRTTGRVAVAATGGQDTAQFADAYDDFCVDRDWLLHVAERYRLTIRGKYLTRGERADELIRLLTEHPHPHHRPG